MQVVYPYYSDADNFLDVMYYAQQSWEASTLFAIDTDPTNKVDFMIYSVHDPIQPKKEKAQIGIAVISYIPETTDKEWPNFYINLCLADVIACDTWVLEKLSDFSYPDKAHINLDGVNPPTRKLDVSSYSTEDGIPMYCIGNGMPFWNAYANWLDKNTGKDDYPFRLHGVDSLDKALFVFGSEPIGQLLSNTLAANKRVWLAYDSVSSLFLDSRFTHNFAPKLSKIREIAGSGQAQLVNTLFETMTSELTDLISHSILHEVPKFTSNTSLLSRIMNEVNRAQ